MIPLPNFQNDSVLPQGPADPTGRQAGNAAKERPLWPPTCCYDRRHPRNDIIAKLNGAVVKALIDPKVSRLFSELGLEIPSDEQRTPEGVRAFHKNDIEKWWPIIKAANIKAE